MGIGDKASNSIEEAKGKAKEHAGRATGDEELEADGRADQVDAKLKDGVEHLQDVADDLKDAADDVKDALKK